MPDVLRVSWAIWVSHEPSILFWCSLRTTSLRHCSFLLLTIPRLKRNKILPHKITKQWLKLHFHSREIWNSKLTETVCPLIMWIFHLNKSTTYSTYVGKRGKTLTVWIEFQQGRIRMVMHGLPEFPSPPDDPQLLKQDLFERYLLSAPPLLPMDHLLENTWLQKVRMMRLSPFIVGTKKKFYVAESGKGSGWHFIWHRYCFLVILRTVSRSGRRGQRCSLLIHHLHMSWWPGSTSRSNLKGSFLSAAAPEVWHTLHYQNQGSVQLEKGPGRRLRQKASLSMQSVPSPSERNHFKGDSEKEVKLVVLSSEAKTRDGWSPAQS